MEYYIGIDVGGMSIKGLRVDADGNILAEGGVPTDCGNGGKNLCEGIARLCESLMQGADGELAGVGIGCPGVIESAKGEIVFAVNLNLKNYPLGEELSKRL